MQNIIYLHLTIVYNKHFWCINKFDYTILIISGLKILCYIIPKILNKIKELYKNNKIHVQDISQILQKFLF